MVSPPAVGAFVDIETFFDTVLAHEGYRCIATQVPADGGRMRHKFFETNAAAAEFALAADRAPHQIFFACSNFLTPTRRQGENAAAARSFWLDLDVEPPEPDPDKPKPYATIHDAYRALIAFKLELGLPQPLVIKSGYGLHVYWPMGDDIDPDTWRHVSTMLKLAAEKQGLKADPARTADIASILRPPGTTHRKGEPRLVRVVQLAEPGLGQPAFQQALVDYLGADAAPDAALPPRPAHIKGGINSDLAGGMEYPPSYGDRVADACAVMGMIRETKGKTDQPTWYHALQLLNKCEDGEPLSHEWSKGDSRYSAQQVDDILARVADIGPTSCAKFADHQPALCHACPHWGKITSPIMLGVEPAQALVVIPSTDPYGKVDPDEPPAGVVYPYGYSWRRSPANAPVPSLCIEVPGAGGSDDPPSHVPVCATNFYPVGRLAGADGAQLEIEMVCRKAGEGRRRFIVDCATVGKGGDGLAGILAKHEITAQRGMKMHMENYLSRWIDEMAKRANASRSHSHYGWHGQHFVVGETMITKDGESPAVLSGNALQEAEAFAPAGTVEEWTRIINAAYNHPGQEAFQFMVLLGFAAPLFPLFKQYGGVTVYAHSDGTGVGKTTAQQAALSVWGNWDTLQLADGKATVNALWALMGVYHNLPVLFDELTNQSNADASAIVFSVSSGRSKKRLKGDGLLQTNNANWSTILMGSGNNLLSDKIAQHRANAEPELARLFEFTVNTKSPLTPTEASELFPGLLENYGHAGRRFMSFVVENYDDVQGLLTHYLGDINAEGVITQGERYWAALFASVLTALALARQLKLVAFPIEPVKKWMLSTLERNRVSRDAAVTDPVALFGQMVQDLAPGIIVTVGVGDLRVPLGEAKIAFQPHGTITGRAIVAAGKSTGHEHLALTVSAIKQWCNKHSASSSTMFDAMVAAGYADPELKKVILGRGTVEYAGVTTQVRCWIVHPLRMGLDLGLPTVSDAQNNVVSMGVKKRNDI